jgi:general secretion pathway protein D
MKFIKLSIVLFSIVVVVSVLSPLSLAGTDSQGRTTEQSRPKIAFNFVDVEISTIVKFISEITGKNFLFDERIKGKITIIAPTKLSIDESFTLFTSVLNLKGFTIIPTGPKTYKIIPSSLAKQEGIISPDEALPINEGYITKLIPVENIKAEETLQFLRPVISRDGHISSFGPGNMLLVVDSAVNIEKIMSLLKLIDRPSIKEEEAGIHVYFLEYADSTDLAKVLQGIIKDLQTSYKSGQRAAPRSATPESPPILSVTPDKATNALVIVAPYSDYQNIVQVVKTLDKKRKQVFVEAMIVEASIDKLKDLGSKWRAIATHNSEPIVVGGVGNIGADTLLNIVNGLSGMSIGGMGNFFDVPITSVSASGTATSQTLTAPGFAALFSLSEFKDAVNVLSTPQILTSDNQEAEILVGENVPFISQRERDLTTATTVLNSITRTDVGIKLQITPQITEGDYVKLDIFQEISSVKSASDDILISVGPTTTKRSTKTSVLVKDGRTVVIGGLMQERDEESVFKVPLLGDIPLIGWLFKFKSVSNQKTNLLVFLSPHVVKETPQLTKLTEEKRNEFVTKEKFYMQGELLVKFKDDVSKERALEIISQKKATVIKYFESINVYQVQLKAGQDVEDALKDFSSVAEVLYAEPNYKVKLQSPPEELDKKETAPETDMNKTDDMLHDEKTPSPEDTDIERPAPPVDLNNPHSSINEDKALPPPDTDKINPPSGNEVTTPDLTVQDQISAARQVIGEKQSLSAADMNKAVTAETGKVTGPMQMQRANDPDAAMAIDESIKPAERDNESALEIIHASRNMSDSHKYFIQVGAWINVNFALDTLEKLKTHYPDIYMAEEGRFNKVRIPGTMDKKKDSLMLKELKERFNLNPVLVNNKI